MSRTRISPRVIERINAHRSAVKHDLRTPKYRPRVVTDKRRKARSKRRVVLDIETRSGVELMQNHSPAFLAGIYRSGE